MRRHETDEARWALLSEPRHWTVEDAKWVMAAWTASGKPVSVFAAERGIDRERMRRWRSRLGEAAARPVVRSATPGRQVVRVEPAPVTPAPPRSLVPVSVRASVSLMPGDDSAVVVSAGPVQIAVRDPGMASPDWVARLVGRLVAEGVR